MKLSQFKYRELIFKKIFILYDILLQVKSIIQPIAFFVFALSSIFLFGLLVFDLGFQVNNTGIKEIHEGYVFLLTCLFTTKILLDLFLVNPTKPSIFISKMALLVLTLFVLVPNYNWINYSFGGLEAVLLSKYTLIVLAIVLIATETYRLGEILNKTNVSPSLLFAYSFLFIILLGSGLLMMPNATRIPITYLEALFTSTSAVCVTGLVVVDTVTVFTPVGKSIILILIQIGGLGIMAFTGFFSYIFLGTATIKDRLVLYDIFAGEHLGGMIKILIKIMFITIIVEGLGVVFIFYSLEGSWNYKAINAVFHSISAFCNAGFSLFPKNLATEIIQFNYTLQLTMCTLVILGGIGFPVLLSLYNYLKYQVVFQFKRLSKQKREQKVFPPVLGQKLAVRVSLSLLIIGTILYYVFEKESSLSSLNTGAKILVSFVGSVSSRTAGFNMVDIALWSYPTVFFMIFLMWVGASPGSTGGGIKTTTFAIALRAAFNFCRGRRYLEIGNREIGRHTIARVLSIIIVSILIISMAFLLLLVFEPEKEPLYLLFECVSAISTVGLSIVNTAILSSNSKIVLILLMFVGRIGPIILLSGVLSAKSKRNYRLPIEDIAIN